jgi:hypothetical protein
VIVSSNDSASWRATFVYGEPRREWRHLFWDTLCRLRQEWNGPWLCCGDFNEVLVQDEHYGSANRSDAQMVLFRDCLDVCNLVDLGYSGPKYTWSNQQDAQCNIRVRLDRGVANDAFTSQFEDCSVEKLITTSSDHYAIFITLERCQAHLDGPPLQLGFKYEAAWRRAEDYAAVVEGEWANVVPGPTPLHSA